MKILLALCLSFPVAVIQAQDASPAQASPASSMPQHVSQAPSQPLPGNLPLQLTVHDAESLALRNNPQISLYRLLALASQQVTRETKSNYYPNLYGSVTAVEPREGSPIAAGGLNNPIIYERFASGVTVAQLITDFGRTNNLEGRWLAAKSWSLAPGREQQPHPRAASAGTL